MHPAEDPRVGENTHPDHHHHHHHHHGAHEMSDALAEEAHHAVHALDVNNMRPVNEFRRSLILTLGAFGQIVSSVSYAFNLFSGSLQKKYNYDSRAMSTITTVGLACGYFLLPYGIINDYLGPLPLFVLSCVLFTCGTLLMGLTFQGVIEGSVVKLSVFYALLNMGATIYEATNIMTCISVFPTRRGWASAIIKTFMGLGSAIIGSIQVGFFLNNPSGYFYFLLMFVDVVGLAAMFVIRRPSYELTGYQRAHMSHEQKARRLARRTAYLVQDPPMLQFYIGLAVIFVLIVYLPVSSSLIAFLKLNSKTSTALAVVTIILTGMLFLMLVPFEQYWRRWQAQRQMSAAGPDCLAEPTTSEVFTSSDAKGGAAAAAAAKEVVTDIDFIAPQYQTTFLQNLKTLSLWCIFWIIFVTLGTGFLMISNARFIYAALDGKPVDDTVGTLLTVINGTGSALGRLSMSYFEAWTQKRKAEERIPITLACFVAIGIVIVSLVLFLVLPGRSLLLAMGLGSFSTGFSGTISALLLRTMYEKDAVSHYNFALTGIVPGAIFLNRLLYGEWYAIKAEATGNPVCLSRTCVQMPLLVLLGLGVSALGAAYYVHRVYTRFCTEVLAERRRIKESTIAAEMARQEAHAAAQTAMVKMNNDEVLSMDDENEEDEDDVRRHRIGDERVTRRER